jgi:hypothetical protein
MIKKNIYRISISIIVFYSSIFSYQKSSLASVNMELLAEVTKSCQKDIVSPEYYKQMNFDDIKIQEIISSNNYALMNNCVESRYGYSLVKSKLFWLDSTDEIAPGYPGFMAFTMIVLEGTPLNIDCIVSQNPSDPACRIPVLELKGKNIAIGDSLELHHFTPDSSAIYMCPSCVVAFNNTLSEEEMKKGFIKWFISLDKKTRREIMSVIGGDERAQNSRKKISYEAKDAVYKYQEIREKNKQEEQNRRRRELLN